MVQSLFPARRHIALQAAAALARLYAVGPKSASEGIDVCRELTRRGIRATLGKFSRSTDNPDAVVQEYRSASDSLESAPRGAFYLSVKPPALGFDLERTCEIASHALENGHGIHFDSHGLATAAPTFELLERLLARTAPPVTIQKHWQFSITLPSRWKRSVDDAHWAIERGLRVRLVKGEFRADSPVDELEPTTSLLKLLSIVAGRVPEVAIATHDVALAREALRRERDFSSLQVELLYGFPISSMTALARQAGVPVGFYVPYGDSLLAYAVRHLLSNPGKLSRGNYLEAFASPSTRIARTIAAVGLAGIRANPRQS